jgi:hypothetical protein
MTEHFETAFRNSDFRVKYETDSGMNASLFVNLAAFPSFLLDLKFPARLRHLSCLEEGARSFLPYPVFPTNMRSLSDLVHALTPLNILFFQFKLHPHFFDIEMKKHFQL